MCPGPVRGATGQVEHRMVASKDLSSLRWKLREEEWTLSCGGAAGTWAEPGPLPTVPTYPGLGFPGDLVLSSPPPSSRVSQGMGTAPSSSISLPCSTHHLALVFNTPARLGVQGCPAHCDRKSKGRGSADGPRGRVAPPAHLGPFLQKGTSTQHSTYGRKPDPGAAQGRGVPLGMSRLLLTEGFRQHFLCLRYPCTPPAPFQLRLCPYQALSVTALPMGHRPASVPVTGRA